VFFDSRAHRDVVHDRARLQNQQLWKHPGFARKL